MLLVLPVAALCMLALAPRAGAGAAARTVTLRNIEFHPATVSIRRGESVHWVWRDNTEHNVTFRAFHSPTQLTGSYTVRFVRTGVYNYHCTIHVSEGMRGRVVVGP